MAWLTEPLAAAGYPGRRGRRHGDDFVDGYLVEGFARWWERARDLTVVLDQLGEEDLGPVGAAGFSLGGYTVAALLGARVDAGRYEGLFSGAGNGRVAARVYPTLAEELRERLSAADVATSVCRGRHGLRRRPRPRGFPHQPRRRVADYDERSLAAIDKPVAVRGGPAPTMLAPPPDDARL